MSKFLTINGMLALLLMAGCEMQTYQDYPWGDYPWESSHSRHGLNNIQAWDDYYQAFGHDQPKPPGG